jgi:hypothetical protein
MRSSESIKSLSAALNKAQKEIGAAHKGANNPFFKSKYADLGAVMEACKEPLNKNGICVLQPVTSDGLTTFVETVLLHESGEWFASSLRVSCKNPDNPQEMGSAISYARRYSLQSIMFIPAEDDDGEKATAPQRKTETTQTKIYTCMTCRCQIDRARATLSYTKLQKFICEDCEKKLAIKS